MLARIWRKNDERHDKPGAELPSTEPPAKGRQAQHLSDLRRQLENANEDERANILETQRTALETKTKYLLKRFDQSAEGRDSQDVFGYIDNAVRVANVGIFVIGWLTYAEGTIRKISVANSTGREVEGRYPPTQVSRPDVTKAIRPFLPAMSDDEHGFALYVPVDDLDKRETLWHLVFEFHDGEKRKVSFELSASPEPLDDIRRALSNLSVSNSDLGMAFENTVGPCLEELWAAKQAMPVSEKKLTFGSPLPKPLVSVIVPLYRRIDFVKFQIALFSNDSDFVGASTIAEIIYVLDDPRMERELRRLCHLVHLTYKVSFRVVILSRNVGYSGANNAGAISAKGDFLLLLNSDVLPKHHGWLSNLLSTYRHQTDGGALGCRLLYEDGSMQHAGMSFERNDEIVYGTWANVHPTKGYPSNFDRAKGAVKVPAVTGACLLVRKPLYVQVGGLDERYVLGDYEDSDFCLRLHAEGLASWYTPDVELYHLERQSIQEVWDNDNAANVLTLYNMWKHAKRWGHIIEDLKIREGRIEPRLAEEATWLQS